MRMRRSLALLVCAACTSTSAPGWQAVVTNLDRSALSLWAASPTDLYVVGGGLGKGGALILHGDGGSWTELATGRGETLWWVWGTPDGSAVWMVGEQGLVLRWDGHAFTQVPSGTTADLYGVWGAAADDVWIVGGVPGDGGPDDVVRHWNGHTLAEVALPAARGAALFKVWGADANDLWITGEGGTIWHRHGGVFADESLATSATLSTVHGCSAREVYTVGGQSVYRYDGAAWQPLAAPVAGFAAGVACGAGEVLVVGSGGMKLRLEKATGAWVDDTLEAPFDSDFHGALVAPDGGLWIAGGNYIAPASQIQRRTGVVAYRASTLPK